MKCLSKIKYIFLLAALVSCSWNVDDYEDVYKEIENKVSDLDSYWLKKEAKRTQQLTMVGVKASFR